MKIAVVGCGAVGSYYGARLARAGHETHFLLRSDYEAVSRAGVLVKSPAGDFRVHPKSARDPREIGPADLVLIGLKTTANERFPALLPPLVSQHTAVMTLQNGLGNEEALARLFPARQILGGLCFVCLNRTAPGVIEHIEHGQVVVGEFGRPSQPRTHAIAEAFTGADIPCRVSENLAQTHWEKLVWNVPFNGLGVASAAGYEAVDCGRVPEPIRLKDLGPCLTTDRLLADPRWLKLLQELMSEVVTASNALGCRISAEVPDRQIALTRSMGPYKASTLLDFEKGLPLELDSMFLEPLRQAQSAGLKPHRLARLAQVLTALDRSRKCPK